MLNIKSIFLRLTRLNCLLAESRVYYCMSVVWATMRLQILIRVLSS